MGLDIRKLVTGALVLAGAGALGWQLTRPEVVPVDLAMVHRGALEVTVNADGRTRIRDVYEVSAPVAGRVLRAPVRVGAEVTAGQSVVARIEPGAPAFLDARARAQAEATVAQAEAALALAAANVRAAEADLSNAQRQLSRLFSLHERGTVPEAQLEEAEAALDIAAAHLDSAHATEAMRQSELVAAEAVLIEPTSGSEVETEAGACCIELIAPVSGQVLSVVNESARMVAAGTPLVTIGPRGDLEITVDLLSSDAVRLSPGARAYVERWGGPETLAAVVREIEPAAFTKVSALGIEEQRVKVLLDFETPPEARRALGHEFRVYLRIVEWAGADVLRVPVSALFREAGDWSVFTLEGGLARLTPVEIGRRNTELAEVRAGLEAGARVITHPSDRVADGVLVVDRASLE